MWYEAVVDSLVVPDCHWVDVGGGKSIFPSNQSLARELASRCGHLTCVDPSDNLDENELADETSKSLIEDYVSSATRQFDVATLRMVAEHIESPNLAAGALGKIIRPGGHVVVYTPNKWSALSLIAAVTPDFLHAKMARLISPNRLDEDVFPTFYRMNTRQTLSRAMAAGGFEEVAFKHLDDCIVGQRWRWSAVAELLFWRAIRVCRCTYPENNLLGVYRRWAT